MQPDFGTDLHYFLFEQISDELAFKEQILAEIRSALSYWMPYVTIDTVDMNFRPDQTVYLAEPNHVISIAMTLFVTGTNIYLPVRLFIAEDGALTII
jgi:phage baseplate assembly protein W